MDSVRLTLAALGVSLLGGCGSVDQIVINEFVAKNTTGFTDNGTHPDWIELYNTKGSTVDLSGWYLSDDRSDPYKWQIPNGVEIEGKGFVLFIADDDPEQGKLHAEFQLSEDGEDVVLTGPDDMGNPVVDSVIAYGQMIEDTSLARKPDGGEDWKVDQSPSPKASNEKK